MTDLASRTLAREEPCPEVYARQWVARRRSEVSTLDAGACERHVETHEELVNSDHQCTCQAPNGNPPCWACVGAPDGGWPTVTVHCPRCHGTGRRTLSWDERTELAAYCGAEWARMVAQVSGVEFWTRRGDHLAVLARWGGADRLSLGDRLAGLSRWGPLVPAMASVAAARAVLPVWNGEGHWMGEENQCRCNKGPHLMGPGCIRTTRAERAIEAAEEWLREQSEANLRAWDLAHRAAAEAGAGWTPQPQGAHAGAIIWCARIADEATVRAAVCERILSWATS